MTYADLTTKMSETEYEMWLAYAYIKQDECPHCGTEPRDLMDVELKTIKCPVCHQDYVKKMILPKR